MNVKTVFLNENLDEDVYMSQPEGFLVEGKKNMVSGSKIIFLIQFVDDILLDTNDLGLLYETKNFLSENFEMKDMGETSYTINAASNMKAEFVACFEATIQRSWLQNFISGLEIVDKIAKSENIYYDNSVTIIFSKNDKYSKEARIWYLRWASVFVTRSGFFLPSVSRQIFSKKSHISSKPPTLLNDFELILSRSLRALVPKDSSEIFSLLWIRRAVESLSEIHTSIKALIADLHFPLSDWDSSWMNAYLNDSINLLDICIALTSELSWFDQIQLLLQHVLHAFNIPSNKFPFSDELRKAVESHHELTRRFESRNPKLEECCSILQKLAEQLHIRKARNSAKGKVLMRALYGVKIETLFVFSIVIAALSGSSKPLMELHVSGDFLWSEAFNDLKVTLIPEIRARLSTEKAVFLKEVEAVKMCGGRLHGLVCKKEETLGCQCNVIDSAELASMEEESGGKRMQECVSELAESAEKLFEAVDMVSSGIDEFFQNLLSGRDALLQNLQAAYQPGQNIAVEHVVR
ncbi:protein BPS1, chloroplastic-like [Phalaenopsis equestris]|uniref:protein BPS1, chloroplastic-like n=1 Tax=Phalaenopsis equestris TaxID=78828 RepID=UPI0009E46F59|nr:protein BPS1, chloroplastic-like [Phalaenopsis equestris]